MSTVLIEMEGLKPCESTLGLRAFRATNTPVPFAYCHLVQAGLSAADIIS